MTINPALCSVLVGDLNEIQGIEARAVDVRSIDNNWSVRVDDVVIVAEAALRGWRRARGSSRVDPNVTQVIGSLGAFWALQRHPETLGFDGYVDFKWPTLRIVSEVSSIRAHHIDPHGSNVHRLHTPLFVDDAPVELDQVERRIVAYVTMGLSDRDIASKIHMSPQTVRNRVSRLLDRFHLCNRTQLAMMCAQDSRIVESCLTPPDSAPLRVSIER